MKHEIISLSDEDIYLWAIELHWDIYWDVCTYLYKIKFGENKRFNCPKCGEQKYYFKDLKLKTLTCSKCRKMYSPLAKTIFKDTKLLIPVYFLAKILIDKFPKIKHIHLMEILNITSISVTNVKRKIKNINRGSIEKSLFDKYKKDIYETIIIN